MTDILVQKNAKKFHCEKCDFICFKKSNYDKHLLTPKHKNTDKILTNTDAENAENAVVTNEFNCECGNKIDTTFNIDDLKVEKNPKHTTKIMLNNEYGVEMNYPAFNEVVDVYASNDTNKIVDLIVRCVKGIYDTDNYWDAREQTKEELEEFIFSCTKEQFDRIEEFFVTAPKVVQIIETDCPKCNRHNVSRLEGLSNFFV